MLPVCGCSAHFLIAMAYLTDGERQRAKGHLEDAVQTQDYFNNDHILSRAMQARMEADPAWPKWIR